jgi:hypothetical protein
VIVPATAPAIARETVQALAQATAAEQAAQAPARATWIAVAARRELIVLRRRRAIATARSPVPAIRRRRGNRSTEAMRVRERPVVVVRRRRGPSRHRARHRQLVRPAVAHRVAVVGVVDVVAADGAREL